jgi:hypothetical protein
LAIQIVTFEGSAQADIDAAFQVFTPRLVYPLDLLCQREPIASDLLIRASYMRIAGLRRAAIGGARFCR